MSEAYETGFDAGYREALAELKYRVNEQRKLIFRLHGPCDYQAMTLEWVLARIRSMEQASTTIKQAS